MLMNQIANIINTQLIPNMVGVEVTIAEDLSNIADIGTLIENIDENTAKDLSKKFVVGTAKTYFENRPYGKRGLGLMVDGQEYAGLIQRVKMGLLDVADTDAFNIQKNKAYNQGMYWLGYDISNKVYDKEVSYQVIHQIPLVMFRESFNSIDAINGLVGMIEGAVERTIDINAYKLELSTLNLLIGDAYTANRYISLTETYNAAMGFESGQAGFVTPSNCLNDDFFKSWAVATILELKSSVQTINKTFNDGTIETFTPADDIRVTLLNKFDVAISKGLLANTFNKELLEIGAHNTVEAWQNRGTKLITDLSIASTLVIKGESSNTTVSNVVGVIYDKYSCGVTMRPDSVRTDWNGQAGFTTYYHDIHNKYFVDSRNTSIVLCL